MLFFVTTVSGVAGITTLVCIALRLWLNRAVVAVTSTVTDFTDSSIYNEACGSQMKRALADARAKGLLSRRIRFRREFAGSLNDHDQQERTVLFDRHNFGSLCWETFEAQRPISFNVATIILFKTWLLQPRQVGDVAKLNNRHHEARKDECIIVEILPNT